jgi:hypothetical protein
MVNSHCVDKHLNNNSYPIDKKSLYEQKLYEQQIAKSLCNDNNETINNNYHVIESFDENVKTFDCILKVCAVLLLAYVFSSMFNKKNSMPDTLTVTDFSV